MRKILIKTLIVCFLVLLLPFTLTLLFAGGNDKLTLETMNFSIYYESNGSSNILNFDDYLLGVVAANVPAGYEPEALKAQAVIARTYILYNEALLSKKAPDKTSFSTSELGLSYLDPSSLRKYWGEDYDANLSKLKDAVDTTQNKVLVYNGKLILPVFFNTCAGFTRNASEAWGVDIPYLVSVPSKQDVTSLDYLRIDEYEVSALISTLTGYYSGLKLNEKDFFQEVTVTTRDSADYALKIDLGNTTVSGEEFAKVLGLQSSHFYIEEYEGKARIICNGAGHGVGLSQYGANSMAQEGTKYQEILKYYYTGVDVADLSGSDK